MKKKMSKNLIAILIVLSIWIFLGGIGLIAYIWPDKIPYIIGATIFIVLSVGLFFSIRISLDD